MCSTVDIVLPFESLKVVQSCVDFDVIERCVNFKSMLIITYSKYITGVTGAGVKVIVTFLPE